MWKITLFRFHEESTKRWGEFFYKNDTSQSNFEVPDIYYKIGLSALAN